MTEPGPVVLVVEDETQMLRFLRASLSGAGYRVIEAETGEEAVARAAQHCPEIVLLDLGLPDIDGLEVVRRLREWSNVPILVVSARGRELDKIDALDAGADDYLTKPFAGGELLARIRVALRHAAAVRPGGDPRLTVGALTVDLAAHSVLLDGAEVHLTPTEFRLLALLARHAGRVLTQRQLLLEVWGPHFTSQVHYLRVYMAQLRHKLEVDPARPRYLLTEPGVGYRLRDE